MQRMLTTTTHAKEAKRMNLFVTAQIISVVGRITPDGLKQDRTERN